jgi:hypothetical protein
MFAAPHPLTSEQQSALEVLLRGGTIEDARAGANVEYDRLRSWLQEPAFLPRLNAARAQLWQETAGKVRLAAVKGVDALLDVLQELQRRRVRIRAAQILIQFAARNEQGTSRKPTAVESSRRPPRPQPTSPSVARLSRRALAPRTAPTGTVCYK